MISILLVLETQLCYADTRLPKGAEIKVVTKHKDIWVKGYVSGQPADGYSLKKGAYIGYTLGGGKSIGVSAALSFPIADVGNISVSANIPIGKGSGATSSTECSLPIPKKGSYKVYMKKKVRLTVKVTYYRNNKKDKWKKYPYGGIYKTHSVRKVVPELRIKTKGGKWKYIDYGK